MTRLAPFSRPDGKAYLTAAELAEEHRVSVKAMRKALRAVSHLGVARLLRGRTRRGHGGAFVYSARAVEEARPYFDKCWPKPAEIAKGFK